MIRDRIFEEIEDAEICYVTPDVVDRTIRCLESSPLRALDALHLVCALAVQPDLFVSSDLRQIETAKKEGIKVMAV